MQNKYIWTGAVALIILGGVFWFTTSPATSPTNNPTNSPTNNPTNIPTTSTTSSPTNSSTVNPLSIIKTEEVKTWSFVGPYNDNGVLEAKALAEITRLEGILKKGQFTDYELYVAIANQHDLLGDGKKTYDYLSKALQIDSENTGLAWHNMGRLMEKLGAYENARIAFDRAILAQPIPAYYMAKIDFLERHFPNDKNVIEKTKKELGTPNINE